MPRKRGLLKKIEAARVDSWLSSMKSDHQPTLLDDILHPGREQARALSDDELAEVVAREANSKFGLLAAGVIREREAWSTPARWSLLVSVAAFILSIIALLRTS